jgi:tripartite-type tricarboxylate transporter receptor subunit TctC
MTLCRRTLLGTGVTGLAVPRIACAQENWPQRPIRIIVPYPPGGGTDLVTRVLGEAMRPILGQPVIVENRPGANGVIGSDQVARAPADGYLYVSVTSGHLTNRYVMPNMPFHPVNDFTPVAMLVAYPMVLVTSSQAPFTDLRGLIDYARANPGRVSYGTSTAMNSYVGNHFARQIGAEMTEVPYRGGGPMTVDLIAGHLNIGWASPESALSQLNSSSIRIIGVTTKERLPLLRDVPSINESGVPDFDFMGWVGLYGPANLPTPIVTKINAALDAAISQPAIHQRIVAMGNYGNVEGAVAFAARTRSDDARWSRAAQEGLLQRAG